MFTLEVDLMQSHPVFLGRNGLKAAQFKALLAAVGTLTTALLTELSDLVARARSKQVNREVLDSLGAKMCPHCCSTEAVRNGERHGPPRYACRNCRKTYNAATGTPLSRLRDKELFEAYVN